MTLPPRSCTASVALSRLYLVERAGDHDADAVQRPLAPSSPVVGGVDAALADLRDDSWCRSSANQPTMTAGRLRADALDLLDPLDIGRLERLEAAELAGEGLAVGAPTSRIDRPTSNRQSGRVRAMLEPGA